MPILASKMLFICEKLLNEKFISSFSRKFCYLLSKKDLEKNSILLDPIHDFLDPITILKKEDLDPKGSRSDHNLGISGIRHL